MALFSVVRVESFFFLNYFRFLSLQLNLVGLLVQGGTEALPLAGFTFLRLDSLVRGFLAVIFWVYIFEKVLWDGWWPLG